MELHDQGKIVGHHAVKQRKTSLLTEDDIERLASALHQKANEHWGACRFGAVKPADLERAIVFCDKFNKILDNTASLAGRTVLVFVVIAIMGALFAGVLVKIKDGLKVTLP